VQLQCSICDRRVGNWNFLCIDAPAASSSVLAATAATTSSSDSTTAASTTVSTASNSDAADTAAAADAEQPQRKRRRTSGGSVLRPMHLLHEHQSYCPWVHSGESLLHPDVGLTPAEVEAVRAGTNGWELALQALLRAARLGDSTVGSSGAGSSGGDAQEQQQQLAWVPCERTLHMFQETQQLLGEAFK
jgi:hypothetical protein